MLDPKILDLLCCPRCKGDLLPLEQKPGFLCKKCNLLFPIKDGIPVFIIEEAETFQA